MERPAAHGLVWHMLLMRGLCNLLAGPPLLKGIAPQEYPGSVPSYVGPQARGKVRDVGIPYTVYNP